MTSLPREYAVDEREWVQPVSARIVVVARRLWPSLAVGLALWLAWRLARRRGS
jgi:hypothetical protein